jgi:hypothetical protein
MRPDGAPHDAPIEHLDEGTAHAWLDDALPPLESARVEQHVATCAECAAVVAEARGLIAGASRIVSALDAVPGDVIPPRVASAQPAAAATAPSVTPIRRDDRRDARPRSRRWMLRAAAAVVVMAGGAALLTSRSPERATMATADVALDSAMVAAPASTAEAPALPPPVASEIAMPAVTPPTALQRMATSERRAGSSAQTRADAGAGSAAGAVAGAVTDFATPAAPTPLAPPAPPVATAPAPPVESANRPSAGFAPTVPLAQAARAAAARSMADSLGGARAREERRARAAPAAASVAADAATGAGEPARVLALVGCYTLAPDGGAGDPVRRVELLSAPLAAAGPRRGYSARVTPGADSAYWTPLAADSVRVVWFAGGGGTDVRLGPADGGVLRGVAPSGTLLARRAPCTPR